MKSQKKTLIDVSRKRIHTYHLALATVAVVALYTGISASIDARGVIPLSTTLPVLPEEEFSPVESRGALPEVLPVEDTILQDSDSELLDLLRNSRSQEEQQDQWKVVRMRVTAYCTCPRCCGKFADGRTANMHKVRRGDVFVAADKRIPFGTEMIIPGYNQERPVEVKDRGRLIKGNRLDVFFNNHKVAKKWGTRYLDVLVKVEE